MNEKIDNKLLVLQNDLNIIREELSKFDRGESEYRERRTIEGIYNLKKRQIEILKIKKDIELIKPYLKSIKVNLDVEEKEGICCKLSRLDDRRYLEYMVSHVIKDGSDCIKQHGVVIYDLEGKPLFNYIYKYSDKNDFPSRLRLGEHEYTVTEPNKVFIDKNNIILDISTDNTRVREIHYKMKNGRFKEVHQFTDNDFDYQDGRHSSNIKYRFNILTTNDDEKIGSYAGRLYCIDEGRFFNSLSFETIYDKNIKGIIPYFGCRVDESRDVFKKTMEDNNLFLGVNRIKINESEYVNTFCYLDTKGNIVSKLFYFPRNKREMRSYGRELQLKYVDVTNETYEDKLKEVKDLALKDMEEMNLKESRIEDMKNARAEYRYKKRLTLISDSYNIGK